MRKTQYSFCFDSHSLRDWQLGCKKKNPSLHYKFINKFIHVYIYIPRSCIINYVHLTCLLEVLM